MSENNEVCSKFYENELPNLYKGTPSNAYIIFCYAISILANIIYISVIVSYLYYKKSFIRLKMTSSLLKVLLVVGLMGFITVIGVREIIGRQHFPCQLLIFWFHFCIFLLAGAVVGSLYLYIYKLRMQRERNAKYLKLMKQRKAIKSKAIASLGSPKNLTDARTASQEIAQEEEEKVNLFQFFVDLIFIGKFTKGGRIIGRDTEKERSETDVENEGDNQSMTDHSFSDVTDLDLSLFQFSTTSKSNNLTLKRRIFESVLMPLGIMTLFGFPVLIVIIYRFTTDPLLINNCTGCEFSLTDHIARISYSSLYAFGVIVALLAIRNEDDPLGIFSEAKLLLVALVPIATAILLSFIDPNRLNQNYVLEWEVLLVFGDIAIMYAIVLHHLLISKKEKRSANPKGNQIISIRDGGNNDQRLRHKKQLPDASALDVIKILEEPKVRNTLLEHSINELSSENVVFMIKARTWKSIWDKESPEKVARIAINIYQEYINRDSKSTINIPNSAFQEVEKEIQPYIQHHLARTSDASVSTNQLTTTPLASQVKKPRKDLFDECMHECSIIIKTDTLPRFIKSPLFKERVIDSGLLQKIYL